MCKHFDTMADAYAHLILNGWKRPDPRANSWVSADETCGAAIYEIPNTEVVQCVAWEIV